MSEETENEGVDMEARGKRPSYSRKARTKPEAVATGERIQARRKHLKLTQLYMAQRLGLQRAAYSHYEQGYNRIPVDQLLLIAGLLRTSPAYLLGSGEESPLAPNDQERSHLLSYYEALAPEYRPALVACAKALFESLK